MNSSMSEKINKQQVQSLTRYTHVQQRYGCFFCGTNGHRKITCYTLQNRVSRAWGLIQCFIEPKKFCCVWIAKGISIQP